MLTELVPKLDTSHVQSENGNKNKMKREFEGEETSHKPSKRHRKGQELPVENEGKDIVKEEAMEALKIDDKQETEKKIKKTKPKVSEQNTNIENKGPVDSFYELSRAYFKTGDMNRYGHLLR